MKKVLIKNRTVMATTKKTKLKTKDINLPKEDIRIEKKQTTFLPALKKIVKKKEQDKSPIS